MARALGGGGATVVMAVRNMERAAAAREAIQASSPEASLDVASLDLASLASVVEAAAGITARDQRVDLLINNAGLMGVAERRTQDGFEMQLGVNHLCHWALTARLLPATVRVLARLAMRRPTRYSLECCLCVRTEWRDHGHSHLLKLHHHTLATAYGPRATRGHLGHPSVAARQR
jgi:NAD(P)-dependent dehydrogenase (short-subunit alcohol dehydrogenase family)